ncbi:MAG: cation diffusion facilitator family transporter [Nitrospiraceae bacterium]|nr:cation diffusion facilitator family transporter [Nitrospiraceae bacterium]
MSESTHNHSHAHSHAHDHGHGHGRGRMGWVILFNIAITVAEYIGGVLSGSLALLSDASHNFSDVLSLAFSYFGEVVSRKKATKSHSFGLKRAEVVVAVVNAVSLCSLGFIIVIEAIRRFSQQREISLGIMLPVAVIGLAGNLLSVLLLRNSKDKNLNMRSAYLHLFYDALSSVFVITASLAIAWTHWVSFDLIASLVIASLMIWSGIDVLRDALHIFMQGVPKDIDFDEALHAIASVEGVESVHDLHIWGIDSEEAFLSCHACVSQDKHSTEINELVQKLNHILEERFRITHSAIQFEHVGVCDNKAVCCK